VLREEGISLVSDGLARAPFIRDGLTWIPQQLWEPVEKSSGLWTICVHSNTAPDALVEKLRVFLGRNAGQFTSVDRVVADFTPREFGLTERVYMWGTLLRMRSSRFRGKMSRLRERLVKK
jgi:hypothetical protein